eukprot:4597986-Pyramimonas_sp.AAC.1
MPVLPASDWSIVRICPCFLRLIGPSWECARADGAVPAMPSSCSRLSGRSTYNAYKQLTNE